jgi:hypothetical protein
LKIESKGLVGCSQQALLLFRKDLGKKSVPPSVSGQPVTNSSPNFSVAARSSCVEELRVKLRHGYRAVADALLVYRCAMPNESIAVAFVWRKE